MKLYGIIGNPLGHSFSKGYFIRKFEAEGVGESRYENFPLERIEDVEVMLRENPGLVGFNVTIPYKQQIFRYLDSVDPQAKEIGAVNCVKITRGNGKASLKGYNTDAAGFRNSLLSMIGQARPRALVLGTGGASKAVCHVLKDLGISHKLVSRTGSGDILSYDDIGHDTVSSYKLIVNTTPLGTYPNTQEAPAIPYEAISDKHFLFDLVYNPPLTRFLRRGQQCGATIVNGYAMLVGQAEAAYKIWQG